MTLEGNIGAWFCERFGTRQQDVLQLVGNSYEDRLFRRRQRAASRESTTVTSVLHDQIPTIFGTTLAEALVQAERLTLKQVSLFVFPEHR